MANESPDAKSFAAAAKFLMESAENLKDTTKTLKETNNIVASSQSDTASAIKDALGKPLNLIKSEITAPFENIKAAFGMVPGNKILRGLSKDIMKMGQEDREKSKIAASNQAEDEEKNRFNQSALLGTQKGMLVALKSIQKSTADLLKITKEKSGKLLGFLAGLLFSPIAFLTGVVNGLATSIGKIANLLRTVASIFTRGLSEKLINLLAKGFASLRVGLTRIPNLFSSIGTYFSPNGGFFEMIRKVMGLGVDGKPVVTTPKWAKLAYRTWKNIRGYFESLVSGIGGFIQNIRGYFGDIVSEIRGFIQRLNTASSGLRNFLRPFITSFQSAFRTITVFTRGIGVVLGRLLWPITLLMSAYDFISGFIEGYKKDGIIGGLRDGVSKLFSNLIGAPLNMLKDAAAWVLRQFGFNESAEELKKFDFKKIITDIISWPYNQLLKIIDMVKNFDFKSLLPDFAKNLFGGGEKNKTPEQKAIDDRQQKIRELGIDVNRREMGIRSLKADAEHQGWLETDESQARAVKKYTMAQKELDKMKAELESLRAGGSGSTVINQNTVDASQNNNSTSVTTPPMTDPMYGWANAVF